MNANSKIFLAGHRGLVGSAIMQALESAGYHNIITKTHSELDLTNQSKTEKFFAEQKPEYVVLAAAKVGGIMANIKYRADFIYENLAIQNNVIYNAYKYGVKKLLFLGSTCIYPKNSTQPMREEYLLNSELEFTNEPYSLAKIAGLKMCEAFNLQYGTNFISVMPSNIYGINDNFDLETSHALPALIRKMHLAKLLSQEKYDEVLSNLELDDIELAKEYLNKFGVSKNSLKVYGTGNARREWLYADDMAEACVYVLENLNFIDMYDKNAKEIKNTHINIGTGSDISMKDLAYLIKDIVGFNGNIEFDTSKPDGMMKKLSDCSKINKLGWKSKIPLDQGIETLYKWYLDKYR